MKSKNLTLASLFAGLLMFMNPTGSEACTRAVYLGPDNMVVTIVPHRVILFPTGR